MKKKEKKKRKKKIRLFSAGKTIGRFSVRSGRARRRRRADVTSQKGRKIIDGVFPY
jgi:hypothetical protein